MYVEYRLTPPQFSALYNSLSEFATDEVRKDVHLYKCGSDVWYRMREETDAQGRTVTFYMTTLAPGQPPKDLKDYVMLVRDNDELLVRFEEVDGERIYWGYSYSHSTQRVQITRM